MAQAVRGQGSKYQNKKKLSGKNHFFRNFIQKRTQCITSVKKKSKKIKRHIFKTFMQGICALQEIQSIGIHNVLIVQGFAMHYRAIWNMAIHLEVFQYESPGSTQSC